MEWTYISILNHAMYPKGLEKGAEKLHISAVIFIIAWVTLANKQKQSKCPRTANSINKLWYTHNGIWFSPSKMVILTMLQSGLTLGSLY